MMNDSVPHVQAQAGSAGLCDRCLHMQRVVSARGSVFYLCRLSFTDARFPRYPPIPVLACPGYANDEPELEP